MKIHIVQKGDTLWKIAKKYGVNFEELKKMNSQLSNPDMIMPGMKVKIPTTGGSIKKEAPMGTKPEMLHSGAKKEMPIAKEKPIAMPIKEAPVKEVPIKEIPIKEIPIKEVPIAKEVPNAPYVPKMPLQIIPEIDINNYYTMNMQNMTVEQPPPPPKANIIPEVKEVPKKEVPIKVPVVEAPIQAPPPPPPPAPEPVQMECQDYCVPVTPVMPGPGFCPPFDPVMPFHSVPYPVSTGFMPPAPGYVASSPGYSAAPSVTGVNPAVAGTSFMPPHYDDESSSFMPQQSMANPGYPPGSFMGTQNPYIQQPGPAYMDPAAQYPSGGYPMASGYPGAVPPGEYPAAYQQGVPSGYAGEYPGYPPTGPAGIPGGYPAGVPAGYPAGVQGGYPAGIPSGYPAEFPGTYYTGAPSGFQPGYQGGVPVVPPVSEPGYMNPAMAPQYGQYPYGYPQMGGPAQGGMGVTGYEYPEFSSGGYMPQRQETAPAQSLPVGTGALGDCGCGAPPAQPPEQVFVPPTPPIYSAPFASQVNTLQPPLMNPYGMESIRMNPYGMPRYQEESNENGN